MRPSRPQCGHELAVNLEGAHFKTASKSRRASRYSSTIYGRAATTRAVQHSLRSISMAGIIHGSARVSLGNDLAVHRDRHA